VTFDLSDPAAAVPAAAGGSYLETVACPATNQCTAVANDGDESTFDPGNPAATMSTALVVGVGGPAGIACPLSTQCTDVDDDGQEITFNPASPNTPPTTTTTPPPTTTTTPPPTTPTTPPPPPGPAPAATQTVKASDGNQAITLIAPAATPCVATRAPYAIKFSSVTIKGSKDAKLKFRTAAFYIDKGIAHTTKKIKKLKGGKKQTVTVTTYTANTTVRKAATATSLKLGTLKAGTHTLKTVVVYSETIKKGKKRKTVNVSKTLTTKLSVC
jgi:hypothetical protein